MRSTLYISGRFVRSPKPANNYFKVTQLGYAAIFPFCSMDAEEVVTAYGKALSHAEETRGVVSVFVREGGVNAIGAVRLVGEVTDVVEEPQPPRPRGRPRLVPLSAGVTTIEDIRSRFKGVA